MLVAGVVAAIFSLAILGDLRMDVPEARDLDTALDGVAEPDGILGDLTSFGVPRTPALRALRTTGAF